ncbi:MAG: four helix bundle protein [Nitrospiraceae bacterium]|nr:four helix bundle protein [Nitrospiraceae bacterium]
MAIKTFEDLICWQRSRELVRLVYRLTQSVQFQKDFGLKDQIRRAAVSVMSNIAEGFGRGGNKELAQYLYIAKGSLAETRSILYVALDLHYIDEKAFSAANAATQEIHTIITAFIKSIRNRSTPDLKSM